MLGFNAYSITAISTIKRNDLKIFVNSSSAIITTSNELTISTKFCGNQ